jgi:hypothetical protein
MRKNIEMVWKYTCDYCGMKFTDENKCKIHEKLCKKKPETNNLYYISLNVYITESCKSGKTPEPDFTLKEFPDAICIDSEKNIWTAEGSKLSITNSVYIDWHHNGSISFSVWIIEDRNWNEQEQLEQLFKQKERLINFYETLVKYLGSELRKFKKKALLIPEVK